MNILGIEEVRAEIRNRVYSKELVRLMPGQSVHIDKLYDAVAEIEVKAPELVELKERVLKRVQVDMSVLYYISDACNITKQLRQLEADEIVVRREIDSLTEQLKELLGVHYVEMEISSINRLVDKYRNADNEDDKTVFTLLQSHPKYSRMLTLKGDLCRAQYNLTRVQTQVDAFKTVYKWLAKGEVIANG